MAIRTAAISLTASCALLNVKHAMEIRMMTDCHERETLTCNLLSARQHHAETTSVQISTTNKEISDRIAINPA